MTGPPINFLETLNRVDEAIDTNAEIAEVIYQVGLEWYGLTEDASSEERRSMNSTEIETEASRSTATSNQYPWYYTTTPLNNIKARSTIKQFYRDWSAEFASERDKVFHPIFADLKSESASRKKKILVPGAGLGRLVFELCLPNPAHGGIGHDVQGNEISYHQLFGSQFVLNNTFGEKGYPLYPFATSFINHLSRDNQLRRVLIPDVCPRMEMNKWVKDTADIDMDSIQGEELLGTPSMTAGDFVHSYGPPHLSGSRRKNQNGIIAENEHKNAFDVVITLFFLDTASDPLDYIETISNCLKPGGIWINVGPLLWHESTDEDADPGTNREPSHGQVELSEEEVETLVLEAGFRIEKREIIEYVHYMEDPESMLQHYYRPVHFVARKRNPQM